MPRWRRGVGDRPVSGSLDPAVMVLDRTDLNILRWPMETIYPIVRTVQLVSYIAITGAEFIGANKAAANRISKKTGG